MTFNNLIIEAKNRILYVTINREAKLNALNKETLKEINLAINKARADDGVKGIIITGAGEKAFVAGADISEFSAYNTEEGKKLAKAGHHDVFDLIENCPKPVIAAINGFALGGGLELAMACHIRMASSNAKMGLPEVTLGLIPGYGGTQRLPNLVGKGRAMEMIMSANMITADQALSFGLINQVLETKEELMNAASKLMENIIQKSPNALKSAIKAINASSNPQKNGFEIEIEEFSNCFGTADFKEGVSAFLEKRKPRFH
ncbi:enoyl-CoA hydratase/isomerase family protein [Pedobacter sp. SD-b]|uniref:Enoyl-CoA hydratase/isomerase family protein n=1 Tax=Pedobacter segetis TaxID=2793069 RepID=A0ABS1BGF4_9SPHI|nr:enoyl-CoA hydratase-related protein [Pedobacter segetis]MBK0381953.1 enoyl-CoA hydratase/isomerase family protein [Pedobacter segetis]